MERLTSEESYCSFIKCDYAGNCRMESTCCDKLVHDRLKEYKDLEEKALLLKLPISIENAVDKLFSHNEIISLWREERENGISVHKRIWYGMAWDIPEELKNCKFVKIFGTIPESIVHADIINIEVVLSEEAEKALAEMEK